MNDNTRSSRRALAPLILPDVSGMTDREASHAYLDAGFMPVPWTVRDGEKILHPRLMKGAVLSEWVTTHEWIDEWPRNARCGLLTSRSGGIIAADLDDIAEFEAWETDADFMDDTTAINRSGRGGGARHIVYDARALAPEDWPRQGNIPGGQVKSNGFIAVEPSLHPNGRPYQWDKSPRTLAPIGKLGPFLAQYRQSVNGHRSAYGASSSEWRERILSAKPGEQHDALLAYVNWLEQQTDGNEIVAETAWSVARDMKAYRRDPYTRKDIERMLHRPGDRPVGNAKPGELAGIEKAGERSLVESMDEIQSALTEWFWRGYGAFGEMTVLDGEKGQGKSLVTLDMVARATGGLAMPGQDVAVCDPVNVIIFAEESSRAREIKPRLTAAGAIGSRVFMPRGIKHDRRGKAAGLVLPDSVPIFRKMIVQANAAIAVWDPITDFLAEDIQTHNDASVRRALRPLGMALSEIGCAGWLLRHMNKDTGARAKFRGSGTTAFQNRARVHLVTGELPSRVKSDWVYGLAVVDSNLTARTNEVLAYSIVDSDIAQDDLGGMVAKAEWHGTVNISADELLRGDRQKPGPRAEQQEFLRDVLEELFAHKHTWPSKEIMARIRAAGASDDSDTLVKVKRAMGIRPIQLRTPGKRGIQGHAWTILPSKIRIRDEDS